MRLFTYGTLKRKGRLEALTGEKLGEPKPAVLPGYKKFPTPFGYPVALERPGEEIEGLIWEIEDADLDYLDHYEGYDEDPPFYFRVRARIRVGDEVIEAWVYVGNEERYRDVIQD